jgi:hypothetical protein
VNPKRSGDKRKRKNPLVRDLVEVRPVFDSAPSPPFCPLFHIFEDVSDQGIQKQNF